MSIVWPAVQLGNIQYGGIQATREDGRIRTKMDVGPAKVRRRTSAVAQPTSIPVEFTGEQMSDFWAFYRDSLLEGTLAFEWEDPATDDTVSFRFLQAPRFSLVIPASDFNDRRWTAVLELERLPDAT